MHSAIATEHHARPRVHALVLTGRVAPKYECQRSRIAQSSALYASATQRSNEAIWRSRESRPIRQMGGVPCLRGLRIPVATIVALIAEGQTTQDVLALYPDLEAEDVREALLYAAEAVRERALPLAAGE